MVHETQIARALDIVQKRGFTASEAEVVMWAAWRPERREALRALARDRGVKGRALRDTVRCVRHLTKEDPFSANAE